MKAKTSVDFKKAAAGDKEPIDGKTGPIKLAVCIPSNPKAVKRGFVKMFVDFVMKRGSATTDDLVKEFVGRQVANKKITKERVLRYISWCIAHDVLKVK